MMVFEFAKRECSQLATALASWLLHLIASVLSFAYAHRLISMFWVSSHQPNESAHRSVNIYGLPVSAVPLCCTIGVLLTFVHPQRAEAVAWLSAQVLIKIYLLSYVHYGYYIL